VLSIPGEEKKLIMKEYHDLTEEERTSAINFGPQIDPYLPLAEE
jgi:hypothetical protein